MTQQAPTGGKKAEWLKFAKFLIMGVLSTLVELALFYVLQGVVFGHMRTQEIRFLIFTYEGPGYLWSYLISTTVGYAIAFVLNRKITFKASANPVFSVVAYVVMVVFTIFATTWLGMWLMDLFIGAGLRSVGEVVTKPLVAVLAMAWTYPVNRFVVHRAGKPAGK